MQTQQSRHLTQVKEKQPLKNETLLIMGGARCLWDDWMATTVENYDIMAVNFSALFLRTHVDHIFSMHSNILKVLKEFLHKQKPQPITHSNQAYDGVDRVWPYVLHNGSSGCYAATVGVALGYEQVILCGCPADNTGNFYDPTWHDDFFKKKRPVWELANDKYFEGKVFSMSGWTNELLGGPE